MAKAIKEAEPARHLELAGIVFDEGKSKQHRMRKLARWMRTGGLSYVVYRVYLNRRMVRERLKGEDLFSLSQRLGVIVQRVSSINSDEARTALRAWKPDIGVSSGNRIIEPSVFTIPRLGMINLHHGSIPMYRGGPPGFWEMFYGEQSMWVTVHAIDDRVDHGAVCAQEPISIDYRTDTPETLYRKAGEIDGRLVVRVLEQFAYGEKPHVDTAKEFRKVHTIPTKAQVRELEARLHRKIDPLGYRLA